MIDAKEPPALEEILNVLTKHALHKLARKVDSGKARKATTKPELVACVLQSRLGRRAILRHLGIVDLVKVCQCFDIPAARNVGTDRLVLRLCWRVFVIHRSTVKQFVTDLRSSLNHLEPIFIDSEALTAGGNGGREIRDALSSASGYVVVVSDDFETAHTRDELQRAVFNNLQRRSPIVSLFPGGLPATPEQVPPPLLDFPRLDGSQNALDASVQKIRERLSAGRR